MKEILKIALHDTGIKITQDQRLICLEFGYSSTYEHHQYMRMLVEAVIEYLKRDRDHGPFLTELMITVSENVKMEFPEIAAAIRHSIINYKKQKS